MTTLKEAAQHVGLGGPEIRLSQLAQKLQSLSLRIMLARGKHTMDDRALTEWAKTGWEQGLLGFPISDQESLPITPSENASAVQVVPFEHGHISIFSQASGDHIYVRRDDDLKYWIRVKTGDDAFAGTNADVFIRLKGFRSPDGALVTTDDYFLDNPDFNDFEQGELSVFQVEAPILYHISAVIIRQNNTGPTPGWLLNHVEVVAGAENTGQGKQGPAWNFPCDRWLEPDKSLGIVLEPPNAPRRIWAPDEAPPPAPPAPPSTPAPTGTLTLSVTPSRVQAANGGGRRRILAEITPTYSTKEVDHDHPFS